MTTFSDELEKGFLTHTDSQSKQMRIGTKIQQVDNIFPYNAYHGTC